MGNFTPGGRAARLLNFARVDLWDITPMLVEGRNFVAVEVAGYNVNAYYVLDEPSFLQAEVVTESEVLASTAGAGSTFQARFLPHHIERVQRYTFQRTFSEVYHLQPRFERLARARERPCCQRLLVPSNRQRKLIAPRGSVSRIITSVSRK